MYIYFTEARSIYVLETYRFGWNRTFPQLEIEPTTILNALLHFNPICKIILIKFNKNKNNCDYEQQALTAKNMIISCTSYMTWEHFKANKSLEIASILKVFIDLHYTYVVLLSTTDLNVATLA